MAMSLVEQPRPLVRRTFAITPAVILLVSLACGRGNEQRAGGDTEPARKVVTGPIVGVVTAASLDDRGRLVGHASSFKPAAPQMSVAVHVGKVAGTVPLTIAWYTTSKQGDQKLFEHTIPVNAFDRAYSVGRNPGLLAVGKYKAVATLGSASKTITWTVAEKQAKPGPNKSADADNAQLQQAGPPTSGVSGKVSVVQRATTTTPPGCGAYGGAYALTAPDLRFEGAVFDSNTTEPDLKKCASIGDLPGDLELLVRIKDNKAVVACTFSAADIECGGNLDPCTMPGGSDLPGTEVRARLRQKSTNRVLAENTDVLYDDLYEPRVQLVSDPSNGATMKRGQKIKLTGIAEEVDNDWHSGVMLIQIVKTPDREVIKSENFPRRKACDKKSLKRTMEQLIYKIPGDAPPAMKFCAYADDWAGNSGEPDCVNILISPKLAGKIRSTTIDTSGLTTSTSQFDGDLALTVQADGSLTGTARVAFTFFQLAKPGDGGCGATSTIVPFEVNLPVTGNLTDDGIVFQWSNQGHTPRRVTFKSNCGPVQTGNGAFEASLRPFMDWPGDWDGAAYTGSGESRTSGPGWTSVHTWNIRLGPAEGAGVS